MIDLTTISFAGQGLNRPECVLTHASGYLFAPDWEGHGGVSMTSPDGQTTKIQAKDSPFDLRPNGIALEHTGTFLLAHLGDTEGGIYRLYPDGHVDSVITDIAGKPLPPTNFVTIDNRGRIWLTVSTREIPRAKDYRKTASSGFIALAEYEQEGHFSTRIVADGLGFTNECILDEPGNRLYVNETFARRLASYQLNDDGSLENYRIICEFGAGCFPDGMAMDCEGYLVVVSIVSNRVIRVSPEGHQSLLLEDMDTDHLAWVEQAWQTNTMGRPHLDQIKSTVLRNLSNIAYGDQDLKRAYFGCLLGESIANVALPVSGMRPLHWEYDISNLIEQATGSHNIE